MEENEPVLEQPSGTAPSESVISPTGLEHEVSDDLATKENDNKINSTSELSPEMIAEQIIAKVANSPTNEEDEDVEKEEDKSLNEELAPKSESEITSQRSKSSAKSNNDDNDENNSNKDNDNILKNEENENHEVMLTGIDSPHVNGDLELKHRENDENNSEENNKKEESNSDNKNNNNEENNNDDNIKNEEDEVKKIDQIENEEKQCNEENENDENDESDREYTTEDFEQQIDETNKSNKAPNGSIRMPLFSYVKRCQVEKMMEQDYEAARRYRTTETIIQNRINFEDRQVDNNSRIQSIDNRLDSLQRSRDKSEGEWNDLIKKHEEEINVKRETMMKKHEEEITNFENHWKSPESLIAFNKASPKLLQLRQIQKNKALSKDFEGAQQTKSIADEIQRTEEEENERLAISTMKTQYSQMKDRHQHEEQCANENWTRHISFLRGEKERELGQIDRAMTALEMRKSQPAPSSGVSGSVSCLSKRAIITPSVASKTRTRGDGVTSKSLTSPRTRKTLINYRTNPNQTRLNLPGIDVGQHLNPSKTQRNCKTPFKPRTTKRYRALL